MFIFADEGGGIAELQDGVVHAACSSHERIGLPRRCRQAACASRTAWKTSESAVHAATATSPRSGRATSIDAKRLTMFRSEERRGGKECVSKVMYRLWPYT